MHLPSKPLPTTYLHFDLASFHFCGNSRSFENSISVRTLLARMAGDGRGLSVPRKRTYPRRQTQSSTSDYRPPPRQKPPPQRLTHALRNLPVQPASQPSVRRYLGPSDDFEPPSRRPSFAPHPLLSQPLLADLAEVGVRPKGHVQAEACRRVGPSPGLSTGSRCGPRGLFKPSG